MAYKSMGKGVTKIGVSIKKPEGGGKGRGVSGAAARTGEEKERIIIKIRKLVRIGDHVTNGKESRGVNMYEN